MTVWNLGIKPIFSITLIQLINHKAITKESDLYLMMALESYSGNFYLYFFRLSGTGSVGATIRIYFEKYESDLEKL